MKTAALEIDSTGSYPAEVPSLLKPQALLPDLQVLPNPELAILFLTHSTMSWISSIDWLVLIFRIVLIFVYNQLINQTHKYKAEPVSVGERTKS